MIIPETDLPPLPEWSKHDNLDGMVPSEIRTALRDYARQAIVHYIKLHEGHAVAWMPDDALEQLKPPRIRLLNVPLITYSADGYSPLFLAPPTQAIEAAVRTGWMCATDFQYELGEASGGNKVYPDLDDLKKHQPCWATCGVIEVEIRARTTPETVTTGYCQLDPGPAGAPG